MTSRASDWIALTGAFFALLPLHLAAQGPHIQFRTNSYDFGRVCQGEVVRAEFVFTNVGDAMLEVTDVRPGCGCTTAGAWDKLVAPGKTGVIPLQFNSAGFFGPVHKTPAVICNDTSQPAIYLQIVGEIWRPVEVNPTFALFNVTGLLTSNQVQFVRITNNTAEPISISELQSSNPSFKPVLREIQPGKEFELAVHLISPLPAGTSTVQGVITAKTSSTNMPLLSITTMAVVQPPVAVFPNTLTLQPGPLPVPTSTALRLFNNRQQALVLTNGAVNISNVLVSVQEEQPGRLFGVTLTFPAGLELPSGTPAEFSIQTSFPDMPLIRVPIAQLAAAAPPPPRPRIQVSIPPPPPPPPDVALPGAPSPEK